MTDRSQVDQRDDALREDVVFDFSMADTLPPDAEDALAFAKLDIDIDLDATDPSTVPSPAELDVPHIDLDLDVPAPVAPMAAATVAQPGPVLDATRIQPPESAWQSTERRIRPSWTDKRVLLVSGDESERMYLRARLALVGWVWVDEAATTTQALAALAVRPYALAIVNMDSVTIDGHIISRELRGGNAAAQLVFTSQQGAGGHPLNLLDRWRRWRLARQLGRDDAAEVLLKPLVPNQVIALLSRLTTTVVT
ncbi:MAG TPA: hypothetical protein PK347_16995 [Burkholderiaceae bacterium]|nr:hypothetical protein [Burkholderiaceae bacterium]